MIVGNPLTDAGFNENLRREGFNPNRADNPNLNNFTPLVDINQIIPDNGLPFNKTQQNVVYPNEDQQSSNFVAGVSGWQIKGNGDVEFNDGTFRGSLTAGSIDIPDTTTANSFHVDANGNAWWGATAIGSATAKVLNTGVATFNSVTATGTMNATGGYIGTTTALVFESQGINTGTTGWIRGNQTDFNTGTGYFLGYSGGTYKFSIGDGANQSATWNGSVWNVKGIMNAMPMFFPISRYMTNDPPNYQAGDPTYFTDDANIYMYQSGSDEFCVYDTSPGGDSQKRTITDDYTGSNGVKGGAKIGSYIYLCLPHTTATVGCRVYRYAYNNLAAGGTQMTVSGTAFSADYGSGPRMLSDGTYLYIDGTGGTVVDTRHIFYKYSISGTTLTYVSTITCGSDNTYFDNSVMDRKGNFYGVTAATQVIRRYDSTGTLQKTISLAGNTTNPLDGFISIQGVPYWCALYLGDAWLFQRVALLPSDIYS